MCLVFATHHSKASYCFMLSHMLFSKKIFVNIINNYVVMNVNILSAVILTVFSALKII
jgi:hypothetical protein